MPRARRDAHVGSILAVAAALLIVVACGTTSTSPRASGATPGVAGPFASGAARASTDPLGAGPSASLRRWVPKAVTSMVALGAADAEIAKAGADLNAAVGREDLKAMWGAADGLAKLIDQLTPDIADLDAEPATQAIAKVYRAAFPEISAGAKQLRDAITAGDAQGILAGTQRLLGGLNTYATARQQLVDILPQALAQQRLLVE